MKRLFNIEITEEEYNRLLTEQSNGKDLKVIDGRVVSVERVLKGKEFSTDKINEYKNKLAETDYKAIKFAEGLISPEEYEPIKQERENLRKAIRSLEISLQ